MKNVNEISPIEVEQLLKKDQTIVLIDVREDEEIVNGMIEDARHIPLQALEQAMSLLDKNKHYVMVCRSGRRSLMAAEFLNENGFDASNMTGGMLDWQGEIVF